MMNRTYFKDLREKATADMLNKSELVYNGYQNNEYIRRMLRAFIGELVEYAASVGIDTVYPLDGHDTSFTITMKAADSYVKAYRSQAKYDDAIENISGLFDKYDSYYFENELVEEDDIYDIIMKAKRSDIKTETFELEDGYFLDAVTLPEYYEFYIYHKNIGYKMLMFGLPKYQQDYDEAVEIAFYNTEEYIEVYDEEYNF